MLPCSRKRQSPQLQWMHLYLLQQSAAVTHHTSSSRSHKMSTHQQPASTKQQPSLAPHLLLQTYPPQLRLQAAQATCLPAWLLLLCQTSRACLVCSVPRCLRQMERQQQAAQEQQTQQIRHQRQRVATPLRKRRS